ncbi:MAG: 6-bladed beta-propeller [Bacteroidota bacterium]|nr:6-bladed beta-propeller [Bacteroidota bacterium]
MNSIFNPRMPTKWRYAGILFLLLPFVACQSGEATLTRFENSPVIDSLLAAAPHFVANTDIDGERWLATTRLGLPNDSLILGSPWHLMAIGDSVYVSDATSRAIFVIGTDGYLSRKIGRPGKGPGEFSLLRGLQYNGSYIFVKDATRVQMFTEKFEFVRSFFSPDIRHQRFSVSPDYVFLQCLGDNWLVCPHNTSPPYAWIEPIKLLPVLDIPDRSGENASFVTASPQGARIAVAYLGLPYIFVYDDQFKHLRTIRFEGSDVRNFSPIAVPPGGAPGDMEPGTVSSMNTIKFINSRYLIVGETMGDDSYYVFDLSENNYKIARKIIFQIIDDTGERKNIYPADFLLHGDYLYVSSQWQEYVYGYEFSLD